jgi:hypothetical protein
MFLAASDDDCSFFFLLFLLPFDDASMDVWWMVDAMSETKDTSRLCSDGQTTATT